MAKRPSKSVRQLMERFGISREDAEFIDPHPAAGHVVGYAQFRGMPIRQARESGSLWQVEDPKAERDGAHYAYSWGSTAYEAWSQCRSSISTRPAFYQCTFTRISMAPIGELIEKSSLGVAGKSQVCKPDPPQAAARHRCKVREHGWCPDCKEPLELCVCADSGEPKELDFSE